MTPQIMELIERIENAARNGNHAEYTRLQEEYRKLTGGYYVGYIEGILRKGKK